MPIISVIVPVYNAEKTLRRCVDSILSQTFSDFELLLIDDGSKDDSGSICDEYEGKDDRVRVFHKDNGGASSARNIGLDNVLGEWVTFCDADDYVLEEWLENYDLTNRQVNADIVSQGFETDSPVFDYDLEESNETYYYFEHNSPVVEAVDSLIRSKTIGFLWIKAFRVSILKLNKIRFDESLPYGEDNVFVYKYLSHSNNSKGIKSIGYHYNVPEWKDKYNRTLDLEVKIANSLYESVCIIFKDSSNEVVRYHREDLISKYLRQFLSDKSVALKSLKSIREIVKKDFWKLQLFIVTRLIILADFTYIFSRCVLRLHLRVKKSF